MNCILWRNLKKNPPKQNCNVCLRIGQNYETFQFIRFSKIGWGIFKNLKECDIKAIPDNTEYIVLDEIKREYGLQD